MFLPALNKTAMKTGNPSIVSKALFSELKKDLVSIANSEIGHKIVYSIQKNVERAVEVANGVKLDVVVYERRNLSSISQRIKAVPWATATVKSRKSASTSYSEIIELRLLPKFFASQKRMIEKIGSILVLEAFQSIPIYVCIKWNHAEEIVSIKEEQRLAKSVLPQKAFLPSKLKIQMKKKYAKKELNALIEHEIYNYHGSAFDLASNLMDIANGKEKLILNLKNNLFGRDLEMIERNFLPAMAALSTLHVNPDFKIMFIDDWTFVVFDRLRPIGRFGKPIDKMPIRQRFLECKKECGSFPGNDKAILDVLDAEGKKKDKQLQELFNDLAKHTKTHSGGVAARTARKLKNAVGVDGKIDWNIFKKSVDGISKRVKDLGYDPNVKRMETAVRDIHAGRSVLPISSMKWDKIFENKDLDWLGALTADVLEDEVNKNPKAMDALNCVANWMENKIACKLDIRIIGSEGVRISFSPAGKLHFRKWKLELQDILKKGPKWKRK